MHILKIITVLKHVLFLEYGDVDNSHSNTTGSFAPLFVYRLVGKSDNKLYH